MKELTHPDELNKEQKARFETYLEGICTSSCGNDYDCPHEEGFFEMLNEEIRKQNERDGV